MKANTFLLYDLFIKPHKLKWCLILLLSSIASLSDGMSFGIIYAAFLSLDQGALAIVKLLSISNTALIDFIEGLSSKNLFLCFIFLGIFFQISRAYLVYLVFNLKNAVNAESVARNETAIIKKILHFSYPLINKLRAGDLMKKFGSIVNFTAPILASIIEMVIAGISCLIFAVLMFIISIKLTISCLIAFFVTMFVKKAIINRIHKQSAMLSKELDSINSVLFQSLNVIKSIQLYCRQKFFFTQMQDNIASHKHLEFTIGKKCNAIKLIGEASGILAIMLALLIDSIVFPTTATSLTAILAFVSISYRFSTRVIAYFGSYGQMAYHWGAFASYVQTINQEDVFIPKEGNFKPDTDFSKIVFDKVSFIYPEKNDTALSNISFSIKKGERIALVGASGSGKSTIVNLITRLYEPTTGTISLDGIPVHKTTLVDWRHLFGVVTQEPTVFHGTIRENIVFGREHVDDQELLQATKSAFIHQFIMRLPLGYDTIVGENGIKLSGGERQRLALARALLKNPPILILDEATSNLDSQSEDYIHRSIDALDKNKTIIFIAHRLSTIANVDHIYVLNDGNIEEHGNHHSLIKKNGLYYALWDLQNIVRDKANLNASFSI